MQQRGSLLVSSGNQGHLSWTCRWSLHSHCLPSLSHVSYTAPQVSVTTWVHLSLQWWTHTPLRQSLCEFRGMWMLTNTIKPTWMHVKVNLRPYSENEFKCVRNGFKGSVSCVWCCCRVNCKVVYYHSVGPYISYIFLIGYFPGILKIIKTQTVFKNMQSLMQCVICCAQNICNL